MMPAVQPHPCRSACPVLWKQQRQFVCKRFMLSARSPAPPHVCERQLFARAAKPYKVERSTEAWKNRLQSRPANTHIPSVTATSVWPDLAAMLRTGHGAAIHEGLTTLSALAPRQLRSQFRRQGSQCISQSLPDSILSKGVAMAAASTVALHSEHEAAKQEILPVLLSLLDAADDHDKLLVAASVYSCLSSFHASLPAGLMTAQHLRTILASLESNRYSSSARSASTYLVAALQCAIAGAPECRNELLASSALPKLLQLIRHDQLLRCQTESSDGVSTDLQHLLVDTGAGAESSSTLTAAALGLMTQLVMSNRAVDPMVVCQMLEAQAVPVLISLLGAYPRAADLLCILAKEKECKEAFLDQSALKALVHCLHIEISGDTTAAAEATGVLWRVATDCDKAKMEVAKAGAVAPAVALLQAARKDALYVASATEAAYLLAVLAEHPCTHQLIIHHGSTAALLQILHGSSQARTTSRTLDSVSASQQGGSQQLATTAGWQNANPSMSVDQSLLSGSGAAESGLGQTVTGAGNGGGGVGHAETSPYDVAGGPTRSCGDRRQEGAEAGRSHVADEADDTAHAASRDVSCHDGFAEQGYTAAAAHVGSAAAGLPSSSTAAQTVHSMHSRSGTGSSGNSPGQNRAPLHSSSNNSEVNSSAGIAVAGGTSIHSRLLQAAHAAASNGTACSAAKPQPASGGLGDCQQSKQHAVLLRDRLLVAANAALVSLTGNPDTHFGIVNEGVAPALVATLQHGTVNAQALACNSLHAISASDPRHAAVFARAGAIPWLVGLIHQWPCHSCGRNAASALKEILQTQDYQSEACACGTIPALVAMLKGNDADCQAAAAALLHVLSAATVTSRKKAISRAGGISALVAVVGGRSAEASMHAAQSLLHMAKLPDLKVLVVQAGAIASVVDHLNTALRRCNCQGKDAQPATCYCACSTSAAARLLGRLSSDQVAQMQLVQHNPTAALLQMLTGGCKSTVLYHDLEGNELKMPCENSRFLMESAAEYAVLRIACHCDDEFREHLLNACIGQVWMGHNIPVALLLF